MGAPIVGQHCTAQHRLLHTHPQIHTHQPTMSEDMFAGLKKKKKRVQIAGDDGEQEQQEQETQQQSDPVLPKEDSADLTLKEDEPLDFSDLKKKKKKKAVAVDLESVETPESAPTTTTTTKAGSGNVDALGNTKAEAAPETKEAPASGEALEEFSGLKKKKKSKKSAFDLEAFEKELAAVEGGSGSATPAGAGSDEEGGDAPGADGENPFDDETGENADGKSKAEVAAEKKAWLSDPDRDYTYTELLGRFYSLLFASHPSLSRGGSKKRYTIAPPNIQREGPKRSIFANVADICKKMHREPEHVIQFLFAELGTSGSVDGSGRLVIKGRFQQKQIENVLRRYIVEYVTCKTCKSPDTLLAKENRIYFVTCETCGSKQSVSSIKVGFQAQTKRRPKAA